ncbi:hypothetical protein LTR97_008009 [Elasticomyces elasticus]|uniref:Uncharacterized protein n=1 Tax=Elasticomyces elasticus TaxID=574655 RepID=A0AAN7ZZL0_9PEZI|nr:hypothetical protein LTR97_008009 [Elasticomyces elasticus]
MYVDSRPLSTFGQTQGWKMPSPEPSGSLKRPPFTKVPTSSSSSLRGMEQTAPSFQDFVRRTPPPADQAKPLPPTPLRPRRPSSFDSASSRASFRLTRRSSSVYSRGTSIWDLEREPEVPTIPSWQTADLSDQDLLLRPIAYSASTSQLDTKPPIQQQLEQLRTYSPLLHTPSPTISRRTTPSPPPGPRPSILLPPPVGFAHVPKKHLRTVSPEKAKEMLQAPGAVHMLPEELRALALGRSRSQDPMRVTSMEVMSGRMTPPELPEAPTLVDSQGRERLLCSPRASMSPVKHHGYPFPTTMDLPETAETSFHVGSGPVRTMAPLLTQTREASRMKVAQALGLADFDDQRGRQKERAPRNMSYEHYMPKQTSTVYDATASDTLISDAQIIAQEYHSLLSEQYRQPSFSSASQQSTRSDEGVAAHMKMVPQPLFHTKPASRLPGTPIMRNDSAASVSPFGMRADSGVTVSERRRSSGVKGFFPMRLSFSSQSGLRRRSTSGSIPISPPSLHILPAAAPPPDPVVPKPRTPSKFRRTSEDNRVSAYYPHVMSRKKGKGKKEKDASHPPAMPLLAADIIAQRTREATPDDSPLKSHPPMRGPVDRSDTASIGSNVSSRRLPNRMLKYTDKFMRSSESPSQSQENQSQENHHTITSSVASPHSPHLLPSPSSMKQPPGIHLGWSDVAKNAFDEARSSIQPRKRRPEPVISHLQTPARPLDESRDGLTEPESPGGRKASMAIFGGIMEGWRDNKAEKRRGELKKMIKVVTPETTEAEVSGAAQKRPSLVSRRWSAYNWV